MKFIALFLSVIVLTLTAMPCCALEDREGHAHQTKKTEDRKCSDQDDDCCKDCSPFYVCGTCIGFTLTPQFIFTFAVLLKPLQHNTVYIPDELPVFMAVIWEPPKTS